MRTGIFGGAFNPVHNGHINLLKCYKRELALDRIIVIPTADPPHKTSEYLISESHRLNMLKLAFKDFDGIEISDIEFKRQGKSYTYDTVEQLKKHYPDDDFYLIVGSDQYLYFQNWYRADDILKSVTLCTAAREKGDEYEKMLSYKKSFSNMKNSIISLFPVVEASSSQIRLRIKQGKSIDNLVPSAVAQYIGENRLYE